MQTPAEGCLAEREERKTGREGDLLICSVYRLASAQAWPSH